MSDERLIASTPRFRLTEGVGRAAWLTYESAGQSVDVGMESGADPRLVALFPVTIRTWRGGSPGPVTPAERRQIVGDIRAVYERMGYHVELVPPSERDWEYYLTASPLDPCVYEQRFKR